MTTRVAGGGGGEYGACHYTLAGGVRVPRNLYFSPFAFPFSFLDSPPTLSFRLSLSLSSLFSPYPPSSFGRPFVARFTVFVSLVLSFPAGVAFPFFAPTPTFSEAQFAIDVFASRSQSQNFTFITRALNRCHAEIVSEFPARVTRARHAITTARRLDHDVPA